MQSQRVMQRLETLYQLGKKADGTHTRMAFSEEDRKGREYFAARFKDLGIDCRCDSAYNLIARLPGTENGPAIVVGSHLDTVPDGGKYDGALGSVAGLELCETLAASGTKLRHPLEIVVYADEEGFRFSSGLTGSSSFCGETLSISDDDLDLYGETRRAVYEKAGVRLSDFPKAARKPEEIFCCLELHVEQGRNLDRQGLPVGIVSTIAGVRRFDAKIFGEANHAGSTMMADRRDALVSAAALIRQLPKLIEELKGPYTVGTVGTLQIEPGAINVIPGMVHFTVEIRDPESALMDALAEKIRGLLEQVCAEDGTKLQFSELSSHAPAPMSKTIRAIIAAKAREMGIAFTELPSGAFHDSLLLTHHFPTAMIFVPSVNGRSHCPEEYTREEDIAKGLDLLLNTVLELDKRDTL